MPREINLLDHETIDKIAAGEVIERPESIVKELVENSIDANSTRITVEIIDGGMKLIRVTDNGDGIPKRQIQIAFLRHATSKIREADDLFHLSSLGFRGEALSSIAAVSETEVITKTKDELVGIKYEISGGKEVGLLEIGAPNGTTFLVKNLFFNTPARKAFMKSESSEAKNIQSLMERLMISKPEIAFTFIMNGKVKLQTNGTKDPKQVIYRLYGKEVYDEVFYKNIKKDNFEIHAYLGTPSLSRGTRAFEHMIVNGRYVKSDIIISAMEEAYESFMMQHKFPFALLYIECNPEVIDVNIHPNKKEIRFHRAEGLHETVFDLIRQGIQEHSMVQRARFEQENTYKTEKIVPTKKIIAEPYEVHYQANLEQNREEKLEEKEPEYAMEAPISMIQQMLVGKELIQESIFESEEINKVPGELTIIGQIFDTYWLVTMQDTLYFVDQHAAHEKVKYERFMKQFEERTYITQNIYPPVILTLTAAETETLEQYSSYFKDLGFVFEHFGDSSYAIREIPMELYKKNEKELFLDILDELSSRSVSANPKAITDRIASMACKSAVKGNSSMNFMEMEALVQELMELENPFFCPHGRPTIISMTKKEIEKKFKRIVT